MGNNFTNSNIVEEKKLAHTESSLMIATINDDISTYSQL